MSKADRKNASKVAQKAKQIAKESRLSLFRETPRIVAVVPLTANLNPETLLAFISGDAIPQCGTYRIGHPCNICFIPCFEKSIVDILDKVRVADFVIYLVSSSAMDVWGEEVQTAVCAQGVPNILVAIDGLDSTVSASLKREWTNYFSSSCRISVLERNEESKDLFLRSIASTCPKSILSRDSHPYIVVDTLDYASGSICGYLRGTCISAEDWIHIPMLGDFPIQKILNLDTNLEQIRSETMDCIDEPVVEQDVYSPFTSDTEDQDVRTSRSVLGKGTSEYQAAWLSDIEEEEEEMDRVEAEAGEEDMRMDAEDSESEDGDGDGKIVDLLRLDARDSAIATLEGYRGIKSLRYGTWEDLDSSSRVRSGRKVHVSRFEGPFVVGDRVRITIDGGVFDDTQNLFVVFGVKGGRSGERGKSTVNFSVKRSPYFVDRIESGENMVVQIGFRRIVARPVFSEMSQGQMHRYVPMLSLGGDVVIGSVVGDIICGNMPVFLFSMEGGMLMGMGAVVSMAERCILKRICLAGRTFKVHQKSVVVRGMFFNSEDVNHFRCVPIRTSCGFKGTVQESLGTHGHMKCVFDRQIKQNDRVLMHLYKRVYPVECGDAEQIQ